MSRASIAATFVFVKPPYQVEVLHLTNSLIHFGCALEIYWIASMALPFHQAAAAALLFACSPLAISAVHPIAFRSSVLSAFWGYLAIGCTLAGYPLIGLLAIAPAIQSREDGFIFSGILFILDPGYARIVMIVAAILFLLLRGKAFLRWMRHRIKNNGDEGMASAGFTESLPQPAYTITAFSENVLRWLPWQFGLGQNPDPQINAIPLMSSMMLSASIAAAATVGFLVTAEDPMVRLALLLILCSPWAGSWFFPLPDVVAEGRAYSTIAGFALLMAPLADTPLLSCTLLAFMACMALFRNYQRRTGISYWKSAWDEAKPKLRVINNIAAAYQQIGNLAEAQVWHQRAHEFAPQNGIVLANVSLWHEGMARVCRREFANDLVLWNRADATKAQAAHNQAVQHMTKAIELMSLGIQYCPDDPCVRTYHEKLWEHARICGLINDPPVIS